LAEFEAAQMAEADRPPAHLNLGVVHEGQGKPEKAEQSYLTALRMDADFLPARVNLANLYNRMGRNADAERQLREGIARAPEEGELYYSLGLLLAEEKRMDESADALGKAAALLPDRARINYNQGLVFQALGRSAEAESALLEGHRKDPSDPSIIQALVVHYANQGHWQQALPFAEKLAALVPGDSAAQEQVGRIREEISRR
ncbi:MAG: tetratricopeptide repeat protein, partial [Deltaproteobacteria bacterium]|nr:tetratricopeptide repeat protein [Deltaproteobacteria bacterium]